MNQLKPGDYTLSIITRLQDNGDGGYTLYGYNNSQELLADHPLAEGDISNLTESQKQDILGEDDAYETGYMGSATIHLRVTENGQIILAKPLNFHAGQ
jgi:hypothetical protein